MSIPRRFDYLRLSKYEIETALKSGFPDASVSSYSLIEEGGINTNYRVSLNEQKNDIALRIMMRDSNTSYKECALLKSMRANVPTPQLYYAEPQAQTISHPFMLTSWLPGRQLSSVLKNTKCAKTDAELGHAIGKVLASIGKRRFNALGMLAPDLSVTPWNIGEKPSNKETSCAEKKSKKKSDELSVPVGFVSLFLKRNAGKHLGSSKANRLFALVKKNAELFNGSPHARLVHGDFNATNILVDQNSKGDWHVTGVLDWEWAHSGTPIFDIANILRWEDLVRPAFREHFIQSFASNGGDLPDHWYERALLTDLLNLLEMINTPNQLHPHQMSIVERIDKTLAHFDS